AWLGGGAYTARYGAAVAAPVLLLGALGTGVLTSPRARTAAIATTVATGLVSGLLAAGTDRTQAGEVAAAIRARAQPGDVVAYCPDQLGPAVSRGLPASLGQRTFPAGAAPQFVDWVGYAARNRAGDPAAFATDLLARAGPEGTIFLVWAPGYRTLGRRCDLLEAELAQVREAETRVARKGDMLERMWLVEFAPG
ncbi:MAG: glycosyltransferase family 39 protein, partial [Acidimicrobiales bacterium]